MFGAATVLALLSDFQRGQMRIDAARRRANGRGMSAMARMRFRREEQLGRKSDPKRAADPDESVYKSFTDFVPRLPLGRKGRKHHT